MSSGILALNILVFSLALWLGLYLLSRDPTRPLLQWSSAGLIAYALAVALALATDFASVEMVGRMRMVGSYLILLPALCWTGALLHLLPESEPSRLKLTKLWTFIFVFLLALAILFVIADLPGTYLLVLVIIPLMTALFLLLRSLRAIRQQKGISVALAATLFFVLGLALLVLPWEWLDSAVVLLALSLDFILFGVAIAWFDAFDQGEAFLTDFVRSFDYAFFTALLFGGQVALVMWLATGVTVPMLMLLLSTIAAAILVQTFATPLQMWLDQIALARAPNVRQERMALRTAASLRPRLDDTLDLKSLEEDEFIRLTRRALSHFGNLPRLATSPLTQLDLVEERLTAQNIQAGTLERANELKLVLAESIDRLKPHNDTGFNSADEWRYYNAVYYPYVLGLKPYSRRVYIDDLDTDAQSALSWFRIQVPERTLYNWQNAAAKLIANDLKERSGKG